MFAIRHGETAWSPSDQHTGRGTCCRVLVAAKTFATVLVVGHYVLRIHFDELPGVCAGATGKPS